MIARRPLGQTGLDTPVLALGTGTASPERLAAILPLALAEGVDAIELDSADRAVAQAIGAALHRAGRAGVRIFCRIAPALPLDLPAPHLPVDALFPEAHIRAEIDAVERALGCGITLAHLPYWSPEWLDEGAWHATFSDLRASGRISGFGIACFRHDAPAAASAIASGRIDSVQLMLNLFDQSALATILPLAAAHGVAVLARAPLHHGALVADSAQMRNGQPFGDWRDAFFYPEHRAEALAEAEKLPPPDQALRFCLQQPLACVVAGMATRAHLLANIAAAGPGPATAPVPQPGWLS